MLTLAEQALQAGLLLAAADDLCGGGLQVGRGLQVPRRAPRVALDQPVEVVRPRGPTAPGPDITARQPADQTGGLGLRNYHVYPAILYLDIFQYVQIKCFKCQNNVFIFQNSVIIFQEHENRLTQTFSTLIFVNIIQ